MQSATRSKPLRFLSKLACHIRPSPCSLDTVSAVVRIPLKTNHLFSSQREPTVSAFVQLWDTAWAPNMWSARSLGWHPVTSEVMIKQLSRRHQVVGYGSVACHAVDRSWVLQACIKQFGDQWEFGQLLLRIGHNPLTSIFVGSFYLRSCNWITSA